MDTLLLKPAEVVQAASLIEQGQLVAFPTETVYGLGADALNSSSVSAVYAAKGRPSDNPLILHICDCKMLEEYVDNLSPLASRLIKAFWPGSLTLIFPIRPDSLPAVVTGGLSTAAFRMPNNKTALELIRLVGRPIVGPSANSSGKPSPTLAKHVMHDLGGKIAAVIDDGPTKIGLESTIVDLSVAEQLPQILRPGAITPEALETVAGSITLDQHLVNDQEAPKAPGMKYKHYAPRAEVYMIDWRKQNWAEALAWAKQNYLKAGILASQTCLDKYDQHVQASYSLSPAGELSVAAQQLFAGLRELDETQVDVIFAETYPQVGLGLAYMNRLAKASGGRVF